MGKKSKGMSRLSFVIGLFSSFAVFCWGFNELIIKPNKEMASSDLFAIAFSSFIVFILTWSVIRLTYWVYCGFKDDRVSR